MLNYFCICAELFLHLILTFSVSALNIDQPRFRALVSSFFFFIHQLFAALADTCSCCQSMADSADLAASPSVSSYSESLPAV